MKATVSSSLFASESSSARANIASPANSSGSCRENIETPRHMHDEGMAHWILPKLSFGRGKKKLSGGSRPEGLRLSVTPRQGLRLSVGKKGSSLQSSVGKPHERSAASLTLSTASKASIRSSI